MSSLINYHDSEDPKALAEIGLFNYSDCKRQLSHFQEPGLSLENIYEVESCESSHKSLVAYIEKQMVNNYLVKGLPTWNVPLARTLNKMPPSLQKSFVKHKFAKNLPQNRAIDCLKTTPTSSLIMTGSTSEGSINIYSTELNAALLGGFNFKQQLYETEEDFEKVFLMGKNWFENLPYRKLGSGVETWQYKQPDHETLNHPEDDEAPCEMFGGLFEGKSVGDSFDTIIGNDYTSDDDSGFQTDFHQAWMSPANLEKPKKEEEKKVEPVAPKKQPKNPKELTEQQKKELELVKTELVAMGFQKEIVEKAGAQATPGKTSLQDLIDDVLKIQTEVPVTPEIKVVEEDKYKSYSCSSCTFLNAENKPKCEMCSTPAPESAKIVLVPTESAEQREARKKEDEEAARKAAELEAERLEKE